MWKRFAFLAVLAAAAVAAVKALRPRPAFAPADRDSAEWPPLDLPGPSTTASTASTATTRTAADAAAGWVEPNDDGTCPEGYPVKVKLSSGIFHVPGGLNYERTNPDRCYPDAAAAEADGFRQSQR